MVILPSAPPALPTGRDGRVPGPARRIGGMPAPSRGA